MEKTYIITIRDLSNEAEFLTSESKRITEKQKQIYKECQVKGHNVIQAIHSFLKHQVEEIRKTQLYITCNYYHITFQCSSITLSFKVKNEILNYSNTLETYVDSQNNPIEKDLDIMKILITEWSGFKDKLFKAIKKAYEEKEKELKEQEEFWDEYKQMFDDFEV